MQSARSSHGSTSSPSQLPGAGVARTVVDMLALPSAGGTSGVPSGGVGSSGAGGGLCAAHRRDDASSSTASASSVTGRVMLGARPVQDGPLGERRGQGRGGEHDVRAGKADAARTRVTSR